jgi:hypothetical protein
MKHKPSFDLSQEDKLNRGPTVKLAHCQYTALLNRHQQVTTNWQSVFSVLLSQLKKWKPNHLIRQNALKCAEQIISIQCKALPLTVGNDKWNVT